MSFISEIDEQRINNLQESLEDNMLYFTNIVDRVVSEYTSGLDELMQNIYTDVISVKNPSISILENYFLRLTNAIYFVGESVERLGIYDSLTKAAAQETYNKTYISHQSSNNGVVGAKKPTVAESTAISENASIYDKTMNDIYNSTYKIVKNKIDAANTMISTLSKIISLRMSDMKLSSTVGNKQILNEDI